MRRLESCISVKKWKINENHAFLGGPLRICGTLMEPATPMHFGAWFWAKDIKESLKKHETNVFILMVEINTLEVIGVGRGSPLGHFLFFEYVFRNLNPKPSDPIRRCNATFLQLQALHSATHDGCACSVVGVLAVSMSCGPELECHGAANRYFCDRALT